MDAIQTDSDTPGLLQPEGLQSWHYDTLSFPHLPDYPWTQPLPVATTGRMVLEHEQRNRTRRRAAGTIGTFTVPRQEQRTPLSNPPGPQDFSGTTARPRAADAAADSAKATVPFEGLQAGRSSGRTKPKYTAARGRPDHATFLDQANAPVQSTGLGFKLYMPRSVEARAGYLVSTDVRIVFW